MGCRSINTGEESDMSYDAKLNGTVVAQLHPGATHSFMYPKAADLRGLSVEAMDLEIELGDHSVVKASGKTQAKLEVNG